jgi:transposase
MERLTDREWEKIRDLIPPHAKTGRPRADDRRVVDGVRYQYHTKCRWRDLPEKFGPHITVYRRHRTWPPEIWAQIDAALEE